MTNEADDKTEERFKRIERKLTILLAIAVVQAVLLALLCVSIVLSKLWASIFPTVLILVLLGAFLWIFRKQVPGWFGSASRWAFSRLLNAQKPGATKDESFFS